MPRPAAAPFLCLVVTLLACGGGEPTGPGGGGDPPPPAALLLSVSSGDAQSGTVASTLARPITVTVTRGGAAVASESVTFRVVAGGGAVSGTSVQTDDAGHASVSWTLGGAAGANTVIATLPAALADTVRFTATGIAGAGSGVSTVSGSDQADTVGKVLHPFLVLVRDANGNPVANEPVDWALSGSGSLSSRQVRTDAAGHASTTLTLGTAAGRPAVVATISRLGNRSAAFNVTALPAEMVRVDAIFGDSTVVAPGQTISPLVAAGFDRFGNRIDEGIDWSASDGTILPLSQPGTAQWALAARTGAQHATAVSHSNAAVLHVFTAFASARPAAIARVSAATFQRTAGAGTAIPALVGRVTDAANQPLSGIPVHWSLTGTGTLTPTRDTSDATGLVQAALQSPDTLAATLEVTVAVGEDPVQSFTVRTLAAAPAALVAVTGDQQLSVPGAVLPIALTVRVSDRYRNPVAGAAVTWDAPTGGGSLVNPASTTTADGTASTQFRLGSTQGAEGVTVHAAGVAAAVAFSEQAEGGGSIVGEVDWFEHPPVLLASPLYSAHLFASRMAPRRAAAPAGSVADELIVTYRANALGVPPAGSAALAAAARASWIGQRLRERAGLSASRSAAPIAVRAVSPALLAVRVGVADQRRMAEAVAALRADPAVESVEPNILLHHNSVAGPRPRRLPNDPQFGSQAWHYGMMDLPESWSLTTGSSSVLVAVVDAGIRFDHPGLAGALTSDGYDFVTPQPIPRCSGTSVDNAGDGDGYDGDPTSPDELDEDARGCWNGSSSDGGHGTHVAGTIGATGNDGVGVTGVAWTARIRPVRVLGIGGVGSAYDIAQGILYAAGLPADDGKGGFVQAPSAARVINLSLGSRVPSTVLQYAIEAAQGAGALIVAAAGNDGTGDAQYPAWYPGVLAVAALGPTGTRPSYSSYGAPLLVAAPGGDISMVDGGGIMSTAYDYDGHRPIYSNRWEGTSMAAAHVSGVAALLLSREPSLSADALRHRIMDYSTLVDVGGLQQRAVNAWQSLTQVSNGSFPLVARLYNAISGQLVTSTPVAGTAFRFDELPAGTYYAFVGEDRDGSGQPAVPDSRWAAQDGAARPRSLGLAAGQMLGTAIGTQVPVEIEDDGSVLTANQVLPGGYIDGNGPAGDVDYYRMPVPTTGTVTITAGATDGVCGAGLEAGVSMVLMQDGAQVATGAGVPGDRETCVQIRQTLTAGNYYVRVTVLRDGRYRLRAE